MRPAELTGPKLDEGNFTHRPPPGRGRLKEAAERTAKPKEVERL